MTLIYELMEATGLGRSDLMRIIDSAPARYKVYEIPKRHGGFRTIAHPAQELKVIQRFLLHEKLSRMPVHPCAMAYEEGRGIFDNAHLHKNNRFVLKLDFSDFFHSIKVKDWEYFLDTIGAKFVDKADINLYSKILFWGYKPKSTIPRCLSIGAPSSPKVSNVVLYHFDKVISDYAEGSGVRYTRYADDITLSGDAPNRLEIVEKDIRKFTARQKSPKLRFNDSKRGLYGRGQRRMVTGLVLTPQGDVSLGRDRKRTMHALMHGSRLGILDIEGRARLKGLLGFALAVEEKFVDRLREKYGDAAVDVALKFHAPKRDYKKVGRQDL